MVRRAMAFMALVVLVPVVIGALVGLAVGGEPGRSGTDFGLVALVVVAALAVLGITASLLVRTLRPVRRLIRGAGTLADGDYSIRIDPAGSASLRAVTASFNAMAEELESAREQRRRLLADVGHELRTPLTVLRGELEAMIDGVHAPDAANLTPLLDDVAVMERLLDDLRTLSQAEAGALALHREPTDLALIVLEVAESFERSAAAAGVDISTDVAGRLDADVDPVRIREVLANLVMNGIRAMPDGGRLEIAAHHTNGTIVVRVTDSGVGIPRDALPRVFDRFHKGTGSRGSGLGLTISRDLIEAHGGDITIEASSPAGTAVRFTLPAP